MFYSSTYIVSFNMKEVETSTLLLRSLKVNVTPPGYRRNIHEPTTYSPSNRRPRCISVDRDRNDERNKAEGGPRTVARD